MLYLHPKRCWTMLDAEIRDFSHGPLTHQSKSHHSMTGQGLTLSDLGHDNAGQASPAALWSQSGGRRRCIQMNYYIAIYWIPHVLHVLLSLRCTQCRVLVSKVQDLSLGWLWHQFQCTQNQYVTTAQKL